MHSFTRLIAVGALVSGLLSACSDPTPVFHAAENPGRLSAWNLFELGADELVPVSDSLVFRPANTLFTDYAQKLRTLWIPAGSQARLVDGEIVYPVGTVLSKTFYYPTDSADNLLNAADSRARSVALSNNRLMETRLLVRREAGWDAFPYVWNDDESEAFLRVAGSSLSVRLLSGESSQDFIYFVPNENQCSGCHVTEHPDGDMRPLGAVATQLAASFSHEDEDGPQLEQLLARGWLQSLPEIPAPETWHNADANIEDRALAYLNMNCGHCHNPDGAADTSALLLDGSHDSLVSMGVCKPPVAAGGGAGNLQYSIVPGAPQQSILIYRMRSEKPDEMMPELGRSLIHREGIALIGDWIRTMSGNC